MDQLDIDERIAAPPAVPAPPAKRRWMSLNPWWTLAVVSIIRSISIIDQGGITVLVGPIKADLGISDVQMSLLMGISFTLVSCVLVIPAGYIVDMFSRRWLVGCSMVAWCSISSMTGFASSFVQLWLARSGLACAEAGLPTAAQALIRDAFPPERRGIPFSIYGIGSTGGGALALVIAGTVLAAGEHGAFANWPILGHFRPWQLVLALPGLCTMPLALFLLTIPEWPRRVSPALASEKSSTRDTIRYVRDHWWVFLPFFLSQMTYHFYIGVNAWMPSAIIRGWGISASEYGKTMGTVSLPLIICGLLLSATLIDYFGKRGIGNSALRIAMIGQGFSAVCNISVLHVHAHWLIFTLLGTAQFFNAPGVAASVITLAYITPSRLFGRMTALLFLAFNIVADAPAPSYPPLIAKYLFDGPLAIVSGLNTYIAIETSVALGCILWACVAVGWFDKKYPGGAG